jgi:hypothetical protein
MAATPELSRSPMPRQLTEPIKHRRGPVAVARDHQGGQLIVSDLDLGFEAIELDHPSATHPPASRSACRSHAPRRRQMDVQYFANRVSGEKSRPQRAHVRRPPASSSPAIGASGIAVQAAVVSQRPQMRSWATKVAAICT